MTTPPLDVLTTANPWRRKLMVCAAVLLLAIGVRILHRQDNPTPPFNGMTGEYKAHAMTLVGGNLPVFLHGPNPPSDANVIKHPPGYPLLMAAVYRLFGDSDTALQNVHIMLDAVSAVLVVLLAAEMFPLAMAAVAGLLVALSPQLAYHAIALLPDPLATPPLLLAIYFLARAYKRPKLLTAALAGLCIGLSCWFRSNALLLPLFLLPLVPLLFKPGLRLKMASSLLVASVVLLIPLTIRNWIYFRSFIPVSLSAGITMIEGLSAYDSTNRFHLPGNDFQVTKDEALAFNRPDYLGTRFSPDGVARERYRIKRSLAVIKAHPFWFAGVMARRAASMLRLARVEPIKPQPATTHAPVPLGNTVTSLEIAPSALAESNSSFSRLIQHSDSSGLLIETATQNLLTSPALPVKPGFDYLLRVPLRIEQGSVLLEITDAQTNEQLATSVILHPVNWLDLTPQQQPFTTIDLPFVTANATSIRVLLKNGARKNHPVITEIGTMQIFALGGSGAMWTRYPRVLIRLLQKVFVTAVMLPFTLLGIGVLASRRRWVELGILLVIPLYYLMVQSALWTEFRYILAMHYYLFILAAVGFVWTFGVVAMRVKRSLST